MNSYVDKGSVDGEVSIDTDRNIFHEAKITQPPVDGTVNESWNDVTLEGDTTNRPQDLWNIVGSGEKTIITEGATLDTSGLDGGQHVIFPWGCKSSELQCGWLEPRVIEVGGSDAGGGSQTDVMLSGHMGAGKNGNSLAPENTIMAFEKAEEIGIDAVEFDVQRADDGYVVFHDENTKRTVEGDFDNIPLIGDTVSSMTVSNTAVDKLTELSPTKDYEVVESDHTTPISMDEAEQATIPSLAEALDYLEGTDLKLRIEIKGKIQGDEDLARDVYNMVEDRGMVDRSIFMSFEGQCNSLNPTGRTCTYPALEAIEDASNGQATTAVLWQAQRDPIASGLGNVRQFAPIDAMDEAADEDFDIFVPREDKKYAGRQVGLKAFSIDKDEFVEEVESRGMDYAFMSFDGNLRDMLSYDVEWVSRNRIDRLMNNIQDISPEDVEDRNPDESSDEGGGESDDGSGFDEANDGVIPVAP